MISTDYLVLGSGISGLVISNELQLLGKDFLVLEKNKRTGGLIETKKKHGYLIEQGPNSFALNEELVQYFDKIGIADRVVRANAESRKRAILIDEKIQDISPKTLLFGNKILSLSAKWKIISEPFKYYLKKNSDESIYSLLKPHFGKEILEKIIKPVVGGIYAGDINKLGVKHTFPSLFEIQKKHSSIIKGFLKTKREKREIVNFKEGIGELVQFLSKNIKDKIMLESNVIEIKKEAEGYITLIEREGSTLEIFSKKIISTLPSYTIPKIFTFIDYELKSELEQVEYNDLSTLSFSCLKKEIGTPLDKFGFLVSDWEKNDFIGCIYNSCLFQNRGPDDRALFTVYALGIPDENRIKTIAQRLKTVMQIEGEIEILNKLEIQNAIPQPYVGYEKLIGLVESFENKLENSIQLTGNWRSGVSVGNCITQSVDLIKKH